MSACTVYVSELYMNRIIKKNVITEIWFTDKLKNMWRFEKKDDGMFYEQGFYHIVLNLRKFELSK